MQPVTEKKNEVNNVMAAIIGNLMPICAKDANPELWLIYDYMQKWMLQSATELPTSVRSNSARTAKAILEHLGNLSDRKLARDIERVIKHYTPESPQPKAAAH